MTDPELVLIAAVAADGTIGDDGEMPWHHPADLAHFKETTLGGVVILGRRTHESIVARLGSALPGRTTIVLTRQAPATVVDEDAVPDDSAVLTADSIDAAVAAAGERSDVAYVAGGASVYEQFLPRADRLLITEIPGRYDGDTPFPAVDWTRWSEHARTPRGDVVVVEYHRS